MAVHASYSTGTHVQMIAGPKILHLQWFGAFTARFVKACGACLLVCAYPQPAQTLTTLRSTLCSSRWWLCPTCRWLSATAAHLLKSALCPQTCCSMPAGRGCS